MRTCSATAHSQSKRSQTGYAERHIIELRTIEGRQIRQEVYVFGRLDADGHLEWIEELTRSLPDDETTN